MLAWKFYDPTAEGHRFIFAPTEAAASEQAGGAVCRAPEFDDCAPGPVSARQALARGMGSDCVGCEWYVDAETVVWGRTGDPYCSDECRAREEG